MVEPRVVVDSLSSLAELLKPLGSRRVLVVCGPSRRAVAAATAALEGFALSVFDEARRHVPSRVVEAARERAQAHEADTVVSLGGGAATGLAKMLRRELGLRFVAVPTTYAGSERTSLYAVTEGGDKVTGRDEAVLPDVVLYDVALTREMPLELTVTSLLNALAHPLSVLSTGEAAPEVAQRAQAAAQRALRATERLVRHPRDERARVEALAASGDCARILEQGKPGLQHRLVHRVGARFDVDHASLHAALLPHTVRLARSQRPEAHRHLLAALGLADLEGELFDLLIAAGAPTSLRALAISLEELEGSLADESDAPRELLRAAHAGRRPSRFVLREDWGLRRPISAWGPPPSEARRIVVALHGRGGNADSMLRHCLAATGDDPAIAVLSLQAPDDSWYGERHTASRSALGAELEISLGEVLLVLSRLSEMAPKTPLALFGFSQGACLALEVLARRGEKLDALVALSGSGIGGKPEPPRFGSGVAGTRVLLGASEGDPWLDPEEIALTAEQLRAAGCSVTLDMVPGATHGTHDRHRYLARPLLRGAPARGTHGGFRAVVETEDLPGALPIGRNSPRHPAYGLFAEQVNATGFVAERAHNVRSWLYRIRPSAQHSAFEPLAHPTFTDRLEEAPEINLAAYAPLPIPEAPTDFVDGLVTLGGAGSARLRRGYRVHLYAANRNMEDRCFCNADGELLILPQLGSLTLLTECGILEVAPGSLAVVPRGLRFSVLLGEPRARGYVAEVYGRGFELPDRGLAGANGLSETRDFRAPSAWHENRLVVGYRVTHKLGGALHEARQNHSPYDVVAWHGNLAPYTYDLGCFSPITNALFDHPDPSILTVLSAPLDERGSHCVDLVAFVPRWDVAEDTFRPPYFHRNATTELNGVIRNGGSPNPRFAPGVVFLTPNLTPHAVSAEAAARFSALPDEEASRPSRYPDDTLWFQFESALPFCLTPWAKHAPQRDRGWPATWGVHRTRFPG